ncbi:MAG: hypothetical protein AMXMBFR83_03170 [Phycisphaerae bacterium]
MAAASSSLSPRALASDETISRITPLRSVEVSSGTIASATINSDNLMVSHLPVFRGPGAVEGRSGPFPRASGSVVLALPTAAGVAVLRPPTPPFRLDLAKRGIPREAGR